MTTSHEINFMIYQPALIPLEMVQTSFPKLDSSYDNCKLDPATTVAKSVQASALRNQIFQLALQDNPMGSISANNHIVARKALFAGQEAVANALWDWVPCSDGRIYHPLLSICILINQRHNLATSSRSAACANGRGVRTEYSDRIDELKDLIAKIKPQIDYLQKRYWVPQTVMARVANGLSLAQAMGSSAETAAAMEGELNFELAAA